jgi:hypothetical protein
MATRTFTDEERKILETIPRNMIGKTRYLSIVESQASFVYDPNSKKLVTVPIQVTIVPVAKKKVRLTLFGEHYTLSKKKLVKGEGVYLVQELDLLENDMIYALAQALGNISEAMRNLRWATHLKALGGEWTC